MGCNLSRSFLATPSPPRRQGNGVATSQCRERREGVIIQVKPLLPPPLHQSMHGNVEIGIESMPGLDMDNHAP
jgi:hypothetical protein